MTLTEEQMTPAPPKDKIGELIVVLGYIIDAIPEVSDETIGRKNIAIQLLQTIAKDHFEK